MTDEGVGRRERKEAGDNAYTLPRHLDNAYTLPIPSAYYLAFVGNVKTLFRKEPLMRSALFRKDLDSDQLCQTRETMNLPVADPCFCLGTISVFNNNNKNDPTCIGPDWISGTCFTSTGF